MNRSSGDAKTGSAAQQHRRELRSQGRLQQGRTTSGLAAGGALGVCYHSFSSPAVKGKRNERCAGHTVVPNPHAGAVSVKKSRPKDAGCPRLKKKRRPEAVRRSGKVKHYKRNVNRRRAERNTARTKRSIRKEPAS